MCNVNLPWNAIPTTLVKPGMKIYAEYAYPQVVHEVTKVSRVGNRVFVTTAAGARLSASSAGTYRLAGVTPEEYDYHSGHGC